MKQKDSDLDNYIVIYIHDYMITVKQVITDIIKLRQIGMEWGRQKERDI